ncbi:hypothetical protein ACVOMS_21370 [Bradyrhizobium guangxiense]
MSQPPPKRRPGSPQISQVVALRASARSIASSTRVRASGDRRPDQ